MRHQAILFILCVSLWACDKKGNSYHADMQVATTAMSVAVNEEAGSIIPDPDKIQIDQADKKIIKDGRMGIQVDDLDKTKQKVDAALAMHNGYYANESFQDNSYENRLSLQIRIPALSFEKFIGEIESGDEKVLYKEISARDVTDQFVDIETRLANKRSYLSRYRELLKQTKTMKEVLEVEEQIRVLEEEIESAEGRLRLMNNQINYSTLELTLTKEKEYTYNPKKQSRFFERVKASFTGGWFTFIDIIFYLLSIWPLWIILGVIIWFTRRRKNRKAMK